MSKYYVGQKVTMICESIDSSGKAHFKPCKESFQASTVDSNFRKTKSNTEYKTVDFHSAEARDYIKKDDGLNTLDNKNMYSGEILVDKNTDELIGRVLVINSGEDKGFIGMLRVFDKYKGQGFGKILILDAVNNYGGEELGVYADNKLAIKMYKDIGFVCTEKVGEDDTEGYFMKLKSKLTPQDKVIEN